MGFNKSSMQRQPVSTTLQNIPTVWRCIWTKSTCSMETEVSHEATSATRFTASYQMNAAFKSKWGPLCWMNNNLTVTSLLHRKTKQHRTPFIGLSNIVDQILKQFVGFVCSAALWDTWCHNFKSSKKKKFKGIFVKRIGEWSLENISRLSDEEPRVLKEQLYIFYFLVKMLRWSVTSNVIWK